ncbi:magnesium transporter [Sulfuricurvum sp.]|uniref:magnesium transporter n=1 Tax=Sulfuricurvum sp. TaxID=2025608 RepID=UPI0019C31FAB|nr:magnesium transporter [Sulfuricurvum sp.]MBD3806327.1 magnesium transporter [Sulfuricurvum sp.]
MIENLIESINNRIALHNEGIDENVHIYEIAALLKTLHDEDEELYAQTLEALPSEILAEVLLEMPQQHMEEAYEQLGAEGLANLASELDTDDAADLIQYIEEVDEELAEEVLSKLPDEERATIETLISYGDNEAGAYMQTELFEAYSDESVGESIKRLRAMKAEELIDNVHQVFIVDKHRRLIGAILLEDLILHENDELYRDILYEGHNTVHVHAHDEIYDVVEVFANYNLNTLAVVDENQILLGRITADDIHDVMEERATEQIYHMAGVSEEAEEDEEFWSIGKTRAIWLGINLITAIAASIVIGMFDATIEAIVALAILMPIVASMGGNAGTQTLTVTVRKIALGEIEGKEAYVTVKREVLLALFNGLLFAVIIGAVAYLWFKIPLLGLVIALSMIINLFFAGFFGTIIPLGLRRAGIDPAIGSTVILTTVTDVVGFLSFLGLATLMLL